MPMERPSACRERALSRCSCASWAQGLVLWDATSSSLEAAGELGLWSSSSGLSLEWNGVECVGHKEREVWEGKEAEGKKRAFFFPSENLQAKRTVLGRQGELQGCLRNTGGPEESWECPGGGGNGKGPGAKEGMGAGVELQQGHLDCHHWF